MYTTVNYNATIPSKTIINVIGMLADYTHYIKIRLIINSSTSLMQFLF